VSGHVFLQKPATTVRIFNRGDYFTLHGADAIFAAKEVFRSAAVVKLIGAENNRIESLALSKSNFESFVRDLLLVKQYRVEVYVTQGSGTKGSNDWVLEYKVGMFGKQQKLLTVLSFDKE
jgi:DNA mismatch repair protein MSH2